MGANHPGLEKCTKIIITPNMVATFQAVRRRHVARLARRTSTV